VGDVLDGCRAGGGEPSVRLRVVEGPAPDVLVRRARGAALLVVGSTGHSELRGLLLGSVALHCAMHAPCPVLVARPGARRRGEGDGRPQPGTAVG
jgi:nucleotide-binding universal stress UspA family protein